MNRANNYFRAFVRIDANLSDWQVFVFDEGDLESVRRAWEGVRAFRAIYERTARYDRVAIAGGAHLSPVRVSVWRPVPHAGPWDFDVGVVGKTTPDVDRAA